MFKGPLSTEDFADPDGTLPAVPAAIETLHKRCGIYTRPEIVDHILDSVGWKVENDLSQATLLEPAAGDAVFVAAAAQRLVHSMRRIRHAVTTATLSDRIRAFEIHPREAVRGRIRVAQALIDTGLPRRTAKSLATRWITIGDFLLSDVPARSFSHVVGNPPYARWSRIPISLRRKYERKLPSRISKGDLFLPFLDISISCLIPGGRLGFVCSNRWQFMAFASDFRQTRLPEIAIEENKALDSSAAYTRSVDVYPSILVVRRKRRRSKPTSPSVRARSRTLGDHGYRIRVGPALGCTSAFVLSADEDAVEPDLLIPWIQAHEIHDGEINWRGSRLIVLHDSQGQLRRLRDYPRAAARLRQHRHQLEQRAIVLAGAVWYRPIDRVIANDWSRPKLLIPEMAKTPRIAIDRSGSIPSHGVYAIFAPDDKVERLYEALENGGLAMALEKIAPKVKGGYVRCYRRFLEQVIV